MDFVTIFWYAAIAWFFFITYRMLRFFSQSDTHTIGAIEIVKDRPNAVVIGHVKRSSTSVVNQLTSSTTSCIDGDTYVDVTKRLSEIRDANGGTECDIDVYLYTPGGSLFMSQLIANLLHQWKGRTRAHIIGYAASGGTLISLACDEIVMAVDSALGPIDPQASVNVTCATVSLEHVSNCASLNGDPRVIELEQLMAMTLQTSAIQVMRAYRAFVARLLSRSYDEVTASRICEFFITDREHSMPIFRHEVENVGVNVISVDANSLSTTFTCEESSRQQEDAARASDNAGESEDNGDENACSDDDDEDDDEDEDEEKTDGGSRTIRRRRGASPSHASRAKVE